MRKLGVLILIISTFMFGMPNLPAAKAQSDIKVLLDGKEVKFDVGLHFLNGRTLVPFRALAEALRVNVTWEASTQRVFASDEKNSVSMLIGDPVAYINGEQVVMDISPLIVDGRVLVPLRFFGEAFGCEIVWDEKNNCILITTTTKSLKVLGYYALGDQNTSSWTDLFATPYPEAGPGKTDIVKTLALGWYSMDEQGNLLTDSATGWRKPNGSEQLLAAARKYELNTEMVVHMTETGQKITKLISSDEATKSAIQYMVSESSNYQGINLDFEGLGFKADQDEIDRTRALFNNFVNQLALELHAKNKSLTLSLHPLNSNYQGYDYSGLGSYADKIIIMAYDYGQQPEPQSAVEEAVQKALEYVPADKLYLGIAVNNENPESLAGKTEIAKRYGLEGIALWRLGLVSDDMWKAIGSNI